MLAREKLTEDDWEEIEETLLAADVGVGATTQIVERLRTQSLVLATASRAELRELLVPELTAVLGPDLDRTLGTDRHDGLPGVVLVVGVNGAGKTTTVGKIARVLVGDGKSVVLGAADTFRAAAADQLETWGERVGVLTVRGREGGDPASVAFEAVRTGVEAEVDTVVVDTAGRLHTKSGLMDELGKVKRVVEKQAPVTEVLLVLDATTGQNGVVQARVFTEAVEVTGVVLTKLDGTAKGGIVVSVQRELGIPVKLIGLGEGADDLAPFEPRAFAEALVGGERRRGERTRAGRRRAPRRAARPCHSLDAAEPPDRDRDDPGERRRARRSRSRRSPGRARRPTRAGRSRCPAARRAGRGGPARRSPGRRGPTAA